MSRVKSIKLSLPPIHRWPLATLAAATRRNKNSAFLSSLSISNGFSSRSDISCIDSDRGTLSHYPGTSHSIMSSSSTSHSPALPLSPTSGYYSLCEVPVPLSPSEVVLDSFHNRSPYTSDGITEGGETNTTIRETTVPRYSHGIPLETIQEESVEGMKDLVGTIVNTLAQL